MEHLFWMFFMDLIWFFVALICFMEFTLLFERWGLDGLAVPLSVALCMVVFVFGLFISNGLP